MNGIRTDPLILEIMARTDKFRSDVSGARALYTTESQRMQRESGVLRQRLERDSTASAATLKKLAGSIGAYFSGREIAGIINSFTQFQNSLRVAGVAASDLDAVQGRLFATAQKYGVELGTLGSLFGSLTNASKELGASQEQIFQLTDVVSASLKVSGQSATEASGALLQLGQALRGGKVQAEEFNSLLDGAFPLLEAAAAGSDRWGGSVAKLTADVKAGRVASKELFDAILEGSDNVIKRAELATVSLSSAYTTLTNALTVYVGTAAQTSGAQAALTQGIQALADNLDTIIPAIAVLGVAMGVKYVASAGLAAVATLRTDAALVGLTTRAEVAGFAMGALARSLAINATVLAVAAAIGGFASETARTASLVQQANTQFDEMQKRLSAAAGQAGAAGDGARGVGSGAAAAEPQVRSFAGAVGDLANQLYRQAQAARTARVEMLNKRLADSRAAETDLAARTPAGRNASVGELRRGDFLNNVGVIGRAATGSIRSVLSGGRTDREAQEAYAKQIAVSRDLARQAREAAKAPLASFVPPAAAAPASAPRTRSGGATAGGGGSSAGPTSDQRREEQERIEQQIASAQINYLQELSQTVLNAAERVALDRQIIEATRAANEQEIRGNDSLSAAQRDKLVELNNQIAGLRAQQLQQREEERLRQQAVEVSADALRNEDELLRLQSDLATTAAERRQIELRRLEIANRLEQAAIAEELAQAQIAGDTQRIAAARARQAGLEQRSGLERANVERRNAGPLARLGERLGDPATDVEQAVADRLEQVNRDIADAVSGFIGAKDPLIKSLINILLEQVLLKPIAAALQGASAGGGGGRGGGGFLGTLASGFVDVFGKVASGILTGTRGTVVNASASLPGPIGGYGGGTFNMNDKPKIFGRASGGYVAAGELYRVNEGMTPGRVEGFRPANSGTIIPLGQMTAARGGGGTTKVFNISVSADNSVTPAGFAQRLAGDILNEAKRMDIDTARATLRAAPAAVGRAQRYGTS